MGLMSDFVGREPAEGNDFKASAEDPVQRRDGIGGEIGIGIALLVVDTDSEDEADPTSVYAWLSIFVVACHSLFTWDAIVGMTC
jgi:hypothetical protein